MATNYINEDNLAIKTTNYNSGTGFYNKNIGHSSNNIAANNMNIANIYYNQNNHQSQNYIYNNNNNNHYLNNDRFHYRNETTYYTNVNNHSNNLNIFPWFFNNNDNNINNNNQQQQQQQQQGSTMHTFEYFDYICVVDFEATCIESGVVEFPHEIIEFPIVLINMKTMQIEDYFQQYVKPIINPRLSNYCMNLTGIKQEQVDNAETFPTVLLKVKEWMQTKQLGTKYRFAVATDGPWDFEKFLNLQCYYSNILYPFWATRWIDVRQMFSEWFGLRKCNIANMLHYFGFNFEGKQHCGLDDSKNIARILMKLVEIGCPISFNGHIRKCHSVIEEYQSSKQFNGFIST